MVARQSGILCNPQNHILTFTYAGAIADPYSSFAYPWGMDCRDGKIYVADTTNVRVAVLDASDLSYQSTISQFNTWDHFHTQHYLCTDSEHIYVTEGSGNLMTGGYYQRIIKLKRDDFAFVAQVGTNGSGDDQFVWPMGICCDDTYLFLCDSQNHRIHKRLKSDLSFVSKIGSFGTGDDQFQFPEGISQYGDYVVVNDTERLVKRAKSDLSYVSQATGFLTIRDSCIDTSGTYLYVAGLDEFWQGRVFKIRFSDLAVVDQIAIDGPLGVTCDDTYLYVGDTWGSGVNIIKKYALSDLSLVDAQYSQKIYTNIGCMISSPEYRDYFYLPPVATRTVFRHKIFFSEGEPTPDIILTFYRDYPSSGEFMELTDISITEPVTGRSFAVIIG